MQTKLHSNLPVSTTKSPSLSKFIDALKKRGPHARRRTSALDAHVAAIDEILKVQGSAIDVFNWVNSADATVSMSTAYKYVAKRVSRNLREKGSHP